jgi:hypothetical protein
MLEGCEVLLKSGLELAVVPRQGDRFAFDLDRPGEVAGLRIGGGQGVKIVFVSPTSEAAAFGGIGYGLVAVAPGACTSSGEG